MMFSKNGFHFSGSCFRPRIRLIGSNVSGLAARRTLELTFAATAPPVKNAAVALKIFRHYLIDGRHQ
jgi:hypothetical protein